MVPKTRMAGIEYAGQPGVSAECQDAVLRFLQFGDRIVSAQILTADNEHCLLLKVNLGDLVAIKSGFASGYEGEGSRRFSYVLAVLEAFRVDIEELSVTNEMLERLDASALTAADIDYLDSLPPVRPQRWHRYVFERHWDPTQNGELWSEFRPVIPYAVLDLRLSDLAIHFWEQPDQSLMKGYRRLEDAIRRRTGLEASGATLMAKAFIRDDSKLTWEGVSPGESDARGNLFANVFKAYRNPRAHQEVRDDRDVLLQEFLLLNHLFRLEGSARERLEDGSTC